MAVTISGKLINGIGEPIKNCKITLKSISTSTTVVAHTTASQIPSATGDYSLSVEPGKYKVTLCVDGFPPEYVGDIQVYKDSLDGTLNYFLGLPQDNDLRPDAIKHFEAMVDKVSSQVAEVEKSKLAAEGSARSAAASADRASQITGLSTVTDAISMASVPLPDVWIPLNDGLQMMAGYGEEVKVGGVTVAKMVSFSRSTTATYIDKSGQLQTAAINEPRFEKEGLFTEGASTNLCQRSDDISTHWANNGNPTTEKLSNGFTKITPNGLFSGKYFTPDNVRLVVGNTYTISFWAYTDADPTTTKFVIGMEKEGSSGGLTRVLTNKPKRYELTFTAVQQIPSIVAYNETGAGTFYVKGFQLEELPFASSYIPTSGSQVTRANELPTIPYGKNACEDMSVAIEITARSYSPPYANWIIDFASNSNNERYAITYNNSGQVFANGFGLAAPGVDGFNLNHRSVVVAVWRASDKQISIYLNGKRGQVANGTQLPVIAPHGLIRIMRSYAGVVSNGNIRNLRIWHKALTEEQARAIR